MHLRTVGESCWTITGWRWISPIRPTSCCSAATWTRYTSIRMHWCVFDSRAQWSADAGRQIHRKDFYRLVEYISPALDAHLQGSQQFVLSVTLWNRLSPDLGEQEELRRLVLEMLVPDSARTTLQTARFRIDRTPLAEALGLARPMTEDDLHAACKRVFGPDVHVAGKLSEHGGCLIVMRSEREDDTSKPLLKAMRKAATQFTGTRPAFIAVQLNELQPQELLLRHVQRRAAILSHALFSHYSQVHVNAAIFSGFNARALPGERFGQAGFAVMNSMPGFAVDRHVLHDVLSAVAAEQPLESSGLSGCEGQSGTSTQLPLEARATASSEDHDRLNDESICR